jgi:hypothetical protein
MTNRYESLEVSYCGQGLIEQQVEFGRHFVEEVTVDLRAQVQFAEEDLDLKNELLLLVENEVNDAISDLV